MGIYLITAMTIQGQGDNIVCEPLGQHRETGKWAGVINLYKGGFFHTTLLSSEPIFSTREEAISEMKEVVRLVREMDLRPQKQEVNKILGKAAETDSQIVAAANQSA